jgi:hypothetical protein
MKPKLKLVQEEKNGPSLSFLMRTRNPFLESPQRFEPTRKADGDVVI